MKTLAINGGQPVRSPENFLVFGAPTIGTLEIEEVVATMKRGWIGTGPKVAEFENAFAAYKSAPYAVAVNSCTAALHVSMIALGIGPGDEVITTPMTFCATINAIIHSGATPVLVDCDRETMNIRPEDIEAKITPRTRAILPVHFAGRCCDMEQIMALAAAHRLYVIEDCAHAIEAQTATGKTGMFGDIGCFSFYVTKNIMTGEGGMVITREEEVADRIKILSLHGMDRHAWRRFSDAGYRHYAVVDAGFKYNMMDIQAAMGIHQLKNIEMFAAKRKRIWKQYTSAFADLPCRLPALPAEGTRHAYHLFTPLLDLGAIGKSRDWVLDALTAENIGAGVHYVPVHLHPYYQAQYGWQPKDCPNANWIGGRTLSLPLSPALEQKDMDDVIAAFRSILSV